MRGHRSAPERHEGVAGKTGRSFGPIMKLLVLGWVLASAAVGAEYYVAPDGSDDNDGTAPQRPFATLARAADAAQAGDTVNIAPGEYVGRFRPRNSGTPDDPIVFRRDGEGEAVITTDEATDGGPWLERFALKISGRSHIVIDGLTFREAEAWIYIGERSSHITVQNCVFDGCRMYHGILISNSDFNTVRNCVFKRAQPVDSLSDMLAIWRDSAYNLVEDCEFHPVGHDQISIRSYGSLRVPHHNIVRHCTFINPTHRALGIHSSKHTLVERCKFKGHAGQFIQLQGPLAIIRHNIMKDHDFPLTEPGTPRRDPWWNAPLLMRSHQSEYGGLAVCRRNRLYNNLFARTTGIMMIRPNLLVADNIFKNNIIFEPAHLIYQEQPRFSLSRHAPPHRYYTFENNLFFGVPEDRAVVHMRGYPDNNERTNWTFEEAVDGLPAWYVGNRSGNPEFIDPAGADYRLREDSPAINAGAPLTAVRQSGEGRLVPVEDPLFFCDGWGRIEGDRVVVGDNDPVRIVEVDELDRTLTLEGEVAFEAGDPVHLDFKGEGPDLGPYEFGREDAVGRR